MTLNGTSGASTPAPLAAVLGDPLVVIGFPEPGA